jgi:hypothetical protein
MITGPMGYALSEARDDTGKLIEGYYLMIPDRYEVDCGSEFVSFEIMVSD